jgi:hypothetical protein
MGLVYLDEADDAVARQGGKVAGPSGGKKLVDPKDKLAYFKDNVQVPIPSRAFRARLVPLTHEPWARRTRTTRSSIQTSTTTIARSHRSKPRSTLEAATACRRADYAYTVQMQSGQMPPGMGGGSMTGAVGMSPAFGGSGGMGGVGSFNLNANAVNAFGGNAGGNLSSRRPKPVFPHARRRL